MFRGSPGFQLAFVLLVLFASYVLQVRNRPYMSTAERSICLDEHRQKAREGDDFQRKMAPVMEHASKKQMRRITMQRLRDKKSRLNSIMSKTKLTGRLLSATGGKEYFWNHNTIEATLLACAVFVCLAGIMFESSQFDERPDLIWMQDLIAVLVAIVLVYSAVYYLTVFSSEVLGKTPRCLERCCADKKKGNYRDESEMPGIYDKDIQMSEMNLMAHKAEEDARNAADEAERLRAQIADMNESQNAQILRMKQKIRQVQKTNSEAVQYGNPLHASMRSIKKSGMSKRGKKKFAGTLAKTKSFRKHETGDGKVYYENEVTGETTWKLPDDAVLADDVKPKKRHSWKRTDSGSMVHLDMASGKMYKVKKGSSLWIQPGEKIVGGEEEGDGQVTARRPLSLNAGATSFSGTGAAHTRPVLSKSPSFRKVTSEDGKVYYHDPVSGKTAWKLPKGATLLEL